MTRTLVFIPFLFQENITQKNYLIIFECVDKLSRKNISEKKYWIGTTNLDYEFRLSSKIWTGNLMDSNL